ncbi:hypothetical protein [Micromonospora vulcania]|uniref:Integral membrane protein n=1 Tax=Micromonospora vulcania TaxID=1441873 RepID=A0ABW1GXC9_9ACTN
MDEQIRARQAGRHNLSPAGWALLCVFLVSTVLVVLALQTATGVTHLAGTSYNTEFANPAWWNAGFLFFLPIFLSSYRYPKHAAMSVIAALVPQFALPTVVVYRYIDGGWGSGLEFFGYVAPILMTPLFATAAAVGAWLGRRVQRPQNA